MPDMTLKAAVLGRRNLLGFLDRLEGHHAEWLTIYVKPSSLPGSAGRQETEALIPAAKTLAVLGDAAIVEKLEQYGTGAVLFYSEPDSTYIVIPPFAVVEDMVLQGGRAETSHLRHLLQRERLLGAVLATWGSYALGVFHGDKLSVSKTGTAYIHKPHRKGGRSQKRFARRTEEQKKDFLRKVANRVDETLGGHSLEQVFFGGNRLIRKPLIEESAYLRTRMQCVSQRFINVRWAGKDVLGRVLDDIYRSVLFSPGGSQKQDEKDS